MRRRLWWATLPYYGWASVTPDEIADGARPCSWYAHPLAWLHRLVEWMGATAFDPLPPVVCDCDDCWEVRCEARGFEGMYACDECAAEGACRAVTVSHPEGDVHG